MGKAKPDWSGKNGKHIGGLLRRLVQEERIVVFSDKRPYQYGLADPPEYRTHVLHRNLTSEQPQHKPTDPTTTSLDINQKRIKKIKTLGSTTKRTSF